MVKKQSFLEHLIVLLSVTIVVSCAVISLSYNTIYADDMVQDKLVVEGASGSWQYCYSGNETDYVSYELGTPVDRLVGEFAVKWRLSVNEYSNNKLTKIALTKTDTGEELYAVEANDDNVGLKTTDWSSEMPAADLQPAIGDFYKVSSGTLKWMGNFITFSKMVFNNDGNPVTLPWHRNESYIEIDVNGTSVNTKYSNFNRTLTLYFNGAEDGPVIPEEVKAVIDMIDNIGEITDSNYLEKESTVNAAKDAYDALESQDLKDQVTNYDTLTAAEASIALFKLAAAKAAAINELKGAFDKSLYSGEELAKLNKAIEDGETAINDATSEKAVSNAKSAAMEEARKAKTDAQIAEEALQKAKNDAKNEIDDKYDLTQYSGDEKAKLEKAIADAKSAIDAAESLEAVTLAKKNGIYEADKAKTDKQIADEKKAEIARKKAAAKKYTVKGLKVTSKSRKFTVTWKKTKGATGYQVQYKLKSAKKYKTLKTLKKLKVTSKKLKKGKKYQFKVRTYTTVKGTKVYGKWTKVKTIKCK